MKLTIPITAILLLAACVSPEGQMVGKKSVPLTKAQIAEIQSAARYDMIDQDSAQFRNIRAEARRYESGRTVTTVCGQVNGKNRMGGYVGFKDFHGEYDESGKFTLRNMDGYKSSASGYICREV